MDARANDSDRIAIVAFRTVTLTSSKTMALSSLIQFVNRNLRYFKVPGRLRAGNGRTSLRLPSAVAFIADSPGSVLS